MSNPPHFSNLTSVHQTLRTHRCPCRAFGVHVLATSQLVVTRPFFFSLSFFLRYNYNDNTTRITRYCKTVYVDGVDSSNNNVVIVRSTVVDRVTNPVAGVENNPLVRRSRPIAVDMAAVTSISSLLLCSLSSRWANTVSAVQHARKCARAVSKHRRVARVFRPCNTYYVLIVYGHQKTNSSCNEKKKLPTFYFKSSFFYISVRCTGSPATAKFVSKQTRFVRPAGVSRLYKSIGTAIRFDVLRFVSFHDRTYSARRNSPTHSSGWERAWQRVSSRIRRCHQVASASRS